MVYQLVDHVGTERCSCAKDSCVAKLLKEASHEFMVLRSIIDLSMCLNDSCRTNKTNLLMIWMSRMIGVLGVLVAIVVKQLFLLRGECVVFLLSLN